MRFPVLLALILFSCFRLSAQVKQTVQWMTFQELEQAFIIQPKPVFIDFWAEWCKACKRMDTFSFSDQEVAVRLNGDFYAVKMNAQSSDSLFFGGRLFINNQTGKKKAGFHDLALLLGQSEEQPFGLPLMLILDSTFTEVDRIKSYLPPKELIAILDSVLSTKD